MLGKVSDAELARLFVFRADADADIDVNDGGFAIGVEEDVQAVGESGAVDGEIAQLGVGEERKEKREHAAAEHSGT